MRTIFFDFGNVVAEFDHRRATRKFAPHTDLTELEVFDLIYNTALEEEFELGHINADEFVHSACAVVGYQESYTRFARDFVDIFTANADVCSLIPKLATRYRLVLASNTNSLHAEHVQEKFADTLKYFAALGMSWEAGARKPHTGFYEYCQSLADCDRKDCLFIDDIGVNVESARAFGWNGIHFTTCPELVSAMKRLGVAIP